MTRANMRAPDGVVHDIRVWRTTSTACGGVVFDVNEPGILAMFKIVKPGPTVDAPIDCLACLGAARTPYAVLCDDHGQQFLTREEYGRQLDRPDSRWMCPRCGEEAFWDDDNYEVFLDDDELVLDDED